MQTLSQLEIIYYSISSSKMQEQKQKDTLSENTQTTSHPETCNNNVDQQSTLNSPSVTSNSISKIIESTEQIINSQAMKIFQLNNELKILKKDNTQLRNKYEILMKMCESGQPKEEDEQSLKINENCVNVEEFVKKINGLEEELVATKMELAQCKAEFLELKYMGMKSQKNIKIQSPENIKFPELQKIKSTIQNLSQIQKTDESLLISEWGKILQNFSAGYPRISKLKQKSLQISKKGIPQSLRQSIWPWIFENKIGITDTLYSQLLHRRNQDQNYTKRVLSQINKDICRSFNGKTKFQSKTGLNAEVTQILEIFHMYRPDVSYVQGMTYPVIVLNLIVGKYKAFTIFSNLILGNEFFLRLYTFQQNYLTCYCRTFDMLLEQKLPKLVKIFNDRSIHSQIYLVEWFYTFFSRGLSYEFTLKIWDLLAYEGEVLFYKLGISIFQLIQNTLLLQSQGQQPLTIIRQFSNYLTEPKLWDRLNNQKLTPEKLQKTFDKIFKKQIIKNTEQNINK